MAVCKDCQKASDNLLNSFTNLERIHLLSSAVVMARGLQNGRAEDKMVSSSVVTKLLLSFPPEARATLIEQLTRSAEVQITLGSCPHSLQVVT